MKNAGKIRYNELLISIEQNSDKFLKALSQAEIRKNVCRNVLKHIYRGQCFNADQFLCGAGRGWSAACKYIAAVLFPLVLTKNIFRSFICAFYPY